MHGSSSLFWKIREIMGMFSSIAWPNWTCMVYIHTNTSKKHIIYLVKGVWHLNNPAISWYQGAVLFACERFKWFKQLINIYSMSSKQVIYNWPHMNSTRFEHHLLVENTSISNALATTPEWLQNGAVPSHLMQPCQQPVLNFRPRWEDKPKGWRNHVRIWENVYKPEGSVCISKYCNSLLRILGILHIC